MIKSRGFTLIELVIVIIILGILGAVAAPKFLNLRDDAEKATFAGIAAAFESGVRQIHYAWLIRGNNQAVQDFIQVSDVEYLTVNEFGYPADTRGVSKTLNSQADCVDVWRAVMLSSGAETEDTRDLTDSTEFTTVYNRNFDCTYTYNAQPDLNVYYNSNNGEVIVSK
ncbi:hypothetical protein GCM10007916_34360 [Psychromonas marina]|uniref:Prepilin-type N-terminal cleavage/methylation domain-containing protein n=1 Tax=Psychromonas marina TaxID=88364 RepID=A0ABQ6E4W1_9GAMM|nr:prepilin-type N-terminal cleavage/methylation domain-containing protein [Psychromonas marina]GLS92365.1 hypothetical protein GCM10007916_34360 [Psychromonas marina]